MSEDRSGESFARAVRGAQALMAYASEAGVEVDDAVLASIIAASKSAPGFQLDADAEASFWKSYRTLSSKLRPVTVSSLASTMKIDSWWRFSGAGIWTIGYTIAAGLVLLALVLLQIYWVGGTTLAENLTALEAQITLEQQKLYALKNAFQEKASKPGAARGSLATDEPYQSQKAKLDNLLFKEKYTYSQLRFWATPVKRYFLDEDKPQPADAQWEQTTKENVQIRQFAQILLDVMQRHILPLLYGLLGTFSFVLRTISTEIKQRSYQPESNVLYLVRICLGALAGVAIGLFLTPDSAGSVITSVSSLALAFVAGYSVDLLFAAMDRVVQAFAPTSDK